MQPSLEAAMERDQYFVVLHEGEWKIKHGEEHSHPYSAAGR